jgi:SlyX protein
MQNHSDLQLAIDELQVKISFQDETIEALNQQVIAQELRIQSAERLLLQLKESLASMHRGQSADANVEEVPPHY